jgi:transcriptional regulator with XRE-family HTH domain
MRGNGLETVSGEGAMQIKLLPRKIIGQTIRGIRTRLGMSPADFAHSLGVADSAEVGRWERGTAQPDYGTLAKIAAMGMVDALVFQDHASDGASPQLTPGEATELEGILVRMEGLLADARALVDRATRRTAVDLLQAASSAAPAQALSDSTLLLDAEVRLEAKPRSRTASAGRRAAGTQPRTRTTRSRGGSSSTSGSSSKGSSSSGGSSGGSSSGTTARSGGARSAGSKSSGGTSRSRSSSSRSGGTASKSGGSSGSSSTSSPASTAS